MGRIASGKILVAGVLVLVGVLLTSCLPKRPSTSSGSDEEQVQPKIEEEALMQSPSEDELVGWEEYKNKKLGFELKYPKEGWSFSENDFDDFLSLSLENKDFTQKFEEEPLPGMSEARYWITLAVRDNPENLLAKEVYLKNFSGKGKAAAEAKLETVSVAGREGIKYAEGAAPASGPSTIVAVTHGVKSYQFSYGALATKETHEKFMDVFEGIIGSFKFVVK